MDGNYTKEENSVLRMETSRLVLRDYKPEDFEEYFRLKSDPKVMYYLQDIKLHSLEEARGILRRSWRILIRRNESIIFFI